MFSSSRGQIFVWTLFDFANTSFSVLIVAVGYSLYFKQIVAGGAGRGDLFWGLAVSISMLLTAVIAPVLGAASDYTRQRKRYLFFFTIAAVVCSALLATVHANMILVGSILFIIANIGFEGGIVFYNAFLPSLTRSTSYGRVSGYGFAMGYVGSLASLLIAIPLYANGFAEENLPNVRLSFVLAAAMFFIFSLPLFLFLRDRKPPAERPASYLHEGYTRVLETLRHLQSYRQIARFLLAFFLYNDGILTVISFASIFAQETLQFSLQEILLLFALVQASAIVGSLIFGQLTDTLGPKRTIIISLLCWITVVVTAYWVESKQLFYFIGVVAGASMGGPQSASRSMMAMLTPPDREAEFFGFYDGFCGKASAVIGTFVFGILSWATGSQRIAVVSVGVFFLSGLWLLRRVEAPQSRGALGSEEIER
ncbi:MAG: MFS transporter [Ignavibacteriae bacterium]|nr:MFS transporter [Ignavibacteriota bacterium]